MTGWELVTGHQSALQVGSHTSVDAAEGKTQESVSGTRGERGGDGVGKLNNLAADRGSSNGDIVSSDASAGSRSISILDAPAAGGILVGRALGGVIDVVSLLVAGREEGGEDPAKTRVSISYFLQQYVEDLQVSTSSVEVQVQLLSANADGNQVLDVVWVGGCCDRAVLALEQGSTEKLVQEGFGDILSGLQVELPVRLEHSGSAIADVVGVVDSGDAERLGGGCALGRSGLDGNGQGENGSEEHLDGQESAE